ncbi:MAG TPA: NapC/NirT family cytochrome c, partial [Longimicrobiales bacterium]|nr:NapC/NirT family cytochrome c [Longimicrobiales bacterium]
MRSSLATVLRNPISAVGVTLATAAGVIFLFLIAVEFLGYLENPYVGIVVFVLVPAVFLLGLLLIPIGLAIERRRARAGRAAPAWPRLDLNDPSVRRMMLFILVATVVNLGIVSVASYGAVEYTESVEFCGQVCHQVMKPEFVAHQAGPHGHVRCVACHVGPGAEGFLRSKLSGTRQLALVLAGSYRRPIATPIESMPGVRTSCENCH